MSGESGISGVSGRGAPAGAFACFSPPQAQFGLPASFRPPPARSASAPPDWECLVMTAYWPLSTGPSPLGSSLNGLNTFNPGRRKSWSLPVTIVRSWRRAVAAI